MIKCLTWLIPVSTWTAHKLDAIKHIDLRQTRLQHRETIKTHGAVGATVMRSAVPVHVAGALAAMLVVEDAVFWDQEGVALEGTLCFWFGWMFCCCWWWWWCLFFGWVGCRCGVLMVVVVVICRCCCL